MQVVKTVRDKKHLTRLIFDDNTEVLLDSDLVLNQSITQNTEISEEQLQNLLYKSDYQRAKSRALWYLDRMDYTEKALFMKLVKAGFNKKACAEVLAKLCELELVSDKRYAERLAARFKENNISKREALQKMFLKGVPIDLAKQVLAETETDEQSQISALLDGKYAYKLTQENGEQKVFAALVRKGFSYSDVRAAMLKRNKELEFGEDY